MGSKTREEVAAFVSGPTFYDEINAARKVSLRLRLRVRVRVRLRVFI